MTPPQPLDLRTQEWLFRSGRVYVRLDLCGPTAKSQEIPRRAGREFDQRH